MLTACYYSGSTAQTDSESLTTGGPAEERLHTFTVRWSLSGAPSGFIAFDPDLLFCQRPPRMLSWGHRLVHNFLLIVFSIDWFLVLM